MERHCSLLLHYDVQGGGSAVPPTEDELRKELESTDPKKKVRGLKSLILLLLNGQSMPKLLMTVIRYCVTTRDHELKKLLSLYWEVVVKYDQEGKLLPEMILVCNAILNDLKHPNHFIRGCTLRFLCRIKDLEILQPLLPTVVEDLAHSDPYVRKNAALVFFTVYQNNPDTAHLLLPDGGETIQLVLEAETDPTARRNFFMFLFKNDTELALQYYQDNLTKILRFGVGFQFVFLEMVRKVCKSNPEKKPMFLKTIFQLLTSSSSGGNLSTAISFEAASTLVSLSSAPTAVRTAATTFIGLLNNSESDNNVRLIVLERLERMKNATNDGMSSGAKIIQENVLDILRVLSVPDREIRRRALAIAMDLVSPRNIKEIVAVLKKEIVKTQGKEVDKEEADEYRQQLIKAIHGCAVKYPAIASTVINLLMDFLTMQAPQASEKLAAGMSKVTATGGSLEVVLFVREIIETYPNLRKDILTKLITLLPEISAPEVLRVSLWLLGEYSGDLRLSDEAVNGIFEALGNKLFSAQVDEAKTEENTEEKKDSSAPSSSVVILADGTYATQTAASQPEPNAESYGKSEENSAEGIIASLIKASDPPLRKLIIEGNYMLAVCVISSLLKIVLKLRTSSATKAEINKIMIKTAKLGCSFLTFGKSKNLPSDNQIDRDSYERINLYLKIMMDGNMAGEVKEIVLNQSRKSLQELLNERKGSKKAQEQKQQKSSVVQPDQVIMFRQLRSTQKLGLDGGDLDDEEDLSLAVNKGFSDDSSNALNDDYRSTLKNIHQLTGFGDPVYAEANVTVHGFDIIVDVMVINKTKQTLLDLNVELATLGDLKLMESSQSVNLSPGAVQSFKTSLKVSSTESAQIFGTIVFDDGATKASKYVNLNYVTIDIMDYIHAATCTEEQFRKMWAEFEWENKVAVNTNFDNLYKFLLHIVKSTNMSCLNIPDLEKRVKDLEAVDGTTTVEDNPQELSFLAANLYARSVFGEDALVNVSVEQVNPTKVEGYIRIRAKTQGIALSLGDRMNIKQKRRG